MSDLSHLSLDELFAQARAAVKRERGEAHKRKAKDPVAPLPEPHTVFSNPDNWTRTRGLALIQRSTQTLLGNFWEWQHRSVKDARRLVRSAEPILVEGVEEIDLTLAAPSAVPLGEKVETQREVRIDVLLETPKVFSAAVPLLVHYYDNWTAKATLISPTLFAEGAEILLLPAGVDIFPVLTRETKILLRKPL